MPEIIPFTLLALSAIFVIVDPFAVLPVFMAMTASDTPAKRRSMAVRACVVAFGMLSGFALFGYHVLHLFGITLSAFKIAGGVLLLLTSLDMLRVQPSRTRSTPAETEEGAAKEDVAIVPLAIPLLAGPGSIATVMVLVSRADGWLQTGAVIVAIAVTCLASLLVLLGATRISRALGKSGTAILGRVMGLLLAAISVQFMADGIREFLAPAARASGL
jgi:multiple antibiotic resistance protein